MIGTPLDMYMYIVLLLFVEGVLQLVHLAPHRRHVLLAPPPLPDLDSDNKGGGGNGSNKGGVGGVGRRVMSMAGPGKKAIKKNSEREGMGGVGRRVMSMAAKRSRTTAAAGPG